MKSSREEVRHNAFYFSLGQSLSCPLDGDRDVDNLLGGGWRDRPPNCTQACIINEFALLCFDVYVVRVTGPSNDSPVTFNFILFSQLTTATGDIFYFFLLAYRLRRLIWLVPKEQPQRRLLLPVCVSCSERSATASGGAWQSQCALMIPPVNCPGLVRHLHCLMLLCEPVTDIYRSVCKENITISAEGEPVTAAFWYAFRRNRAHFTLA